MKKELAMLAVCALLSGCSDAMNVTGPNKATGAGRLSSVADDRPVGDPRNSVPSDAVQNLSVNPTGQRLDDGKEAVNIAFTPVVNVSRYLVEVFQRHADTGEFSVLADTFVIEGRTDVTRHYAPGLSYRVVVYSAGGEAEAFFSVDAIPVALASTCGEIGQGCAPLNF